MYLITKQKKIILDGVEYMGNIFERIFDELILTSHDIALNQFVDEQARISNEVEQDQHSSLEKKLSYSIIPTDDKWSNHIRIVLK